MRIKTFYYPGWEAEIDGKKTNIDVEKDTGAMLINIPKGEHNIELKFSDTPLRCYAKIASMVSLIVIFVLNIISQKRRFNDIIKSGGDIDSAS